MKLFPKDFARECLYCGKVFKNYRKFFEHDFQEHPTVREDEF